MRGRVWRGGLIIAVALLGTTACTSGKGPAGQPSPTSSPVIASTSSSASSTPTTSSTRSTSPASSASRAAGRPEHVVVVVMENHSYGDIIGNGSAPYINTLASQGALFDQSYANVHPSQPNYLILFSGSTQGIGDDSCPHTFTTPNLARALLDGGLSFVGYSEGLPHVGDTVCSSGDYARKHNPWVNFANVPSSANQPLTAFPADYAALPSVSFVIPDLAHDMHDGSVADGDAWLREHLGGYVTWARVHHSLLLLTWDEDDRSAANRIVTLIVGSGVRAGRYSERIDHYRVLRTLTELFGLSPVGDSARVAPITSWLG